MNYLGAVTFNGIPDIPHPVAKVIYICQRDERTLPTCHLRNSQFGAAYTKKPKRIIIRGDLVIANSLLFAGMTNPAGIPNSKVDHKLGRQFWRAVSGQPYFGQAGGHENTLMAQPTMIKALAQLAERVNKNETSGIKV